MNDSQITQSTVNQITRKIASAPGREGHSKGDSETSKEHLGTGYI